MSILKNFIFNSCFYLADSIWLRFSSNKLIYNRIGWNTLIFNFHKPSRIIILSLIISIICVGVFSRFNKDFLVSAQPSIQKFNLKSDLSFSKQIEHFLNNLVKASKDECVKLFGRYAEVIGKKLSLDKLYFASYQEVENLLAQGVNESLDALTFFTYPLQAWS